MEDRAGKYLVALAVDNSIPRPIPDGERGFLPMYFNASPLLLPTHEGADALCAFTTEGKVIGYMRDAAERASIAPATRISLSGRDDLLELRARWSASYVVVDPEYGRAEDAAVTVKELLECFEN